MLRTEVLETMLYGCVPWSPRACHYDTLHRVHRRFLTRCIGWRRKHNHRADHPISSLDTLIKTGSESIEATLRRRRILYAGFVARMKDTRLPKCVRDVRRVGGGRGLCGGAGKRVNGLFLGRLQSFRHQRRAVDDCSPGRGGMTQDGRTRGGTFFHGEMGRCREIKGWSTACSSMPERDRKGQGEDSCPKASGLMLVRTLFLLTRHKWRELVYSGLLVCRCRVVFLWCYVCFVLLRFRLYAFTEEAPALRAIFLRYFQHAHLIPIVGVGKRGTD